MILRPSLSSVFIRNAATTGSTFRYNMYCGSARLCWCILVAGSIHPVLAASSPSSFLSWLTASPVGDFIYRALVRWSDLKYDLGLDIPRSSLLFPEIECSLRIALLGIVGTNYARFPRYFRNDSALKLAQTGTYVNAKNIEEYVKFVNPLYNPYFTRDSKVIDSQAFFTGYDKGTGQCMFRQFLTNDFIFSTNYTNGGEAKFSAMMDIDFNYNQRYITEFRVFYSSNFLDFFFTQVMDTDRSRNFICSVMNSNSSCAPILPDRDNCTERLAALPMAQNGVYVDGNSQGCRIIHAFLALFSPKHHCPHISFTPHPDPDNATKCQVSKGMLVLDLFTQSDMDAFDAYVVKRGFNVTDGFEIVTQPQKM
jgi:hypothetical protein